MTITMTALKDVASINPAWTRQNLPGYTPVGYANEEALHAVAGGVNPRKYGALAHNVQMAKKHLSYKKVDAFCFAEAMK